MNSKRITFAVACLCAFGWPGATASRAEGAEGAFVVQQVAKPAPAFLLRDLDGRDIRRARYDDKALIVFFWATWDGPCRELLPTLVELQKQYSETQLVVIGIALDDKSETVKAFAEQQKLKFPIAMADYQTIQDFGGLEAIPTTFVIDRNHNIINRYVGVVDKQLVNADLQAIFKSESRPITVPAPTQ